MRIYKYILVFSFSILIGQRFDISDPPMIYIYHFVSYDTTSVVFHGGEQDESQNKIIKLPLINLGNISVDDHTLMSKPINPKIVSSMVTSSIAKNRHVKIAGESIQNRINRDNFLKIVQSYDYPERTDFVFLGEINSIADQYEIDLKLIDVSLQKIVGSKSFNLPFNSLTELRPLIDAVVEPLIKKMLSPFLGYAFLSVDSTSRAKIRWDNISIRPQKVLVNKDIKPTLDSDYESYFTIPINDIFLNTHKSLLQNFRPWSIEKEVQEKIIAEYNGYDISISNLGEKAFQSISIKNKEKIIETYILSDEEKENLINIDNHFIRNSVRGVWGNRIDDAHLIKSIDGDGSFMQGDYLLRGYLKNNEKPFEVSFTIKPGDLNQIHMALPYIPKIKDSDGDGIMDDEDACPKLAGIPNEDLEKNGCPEPIEELVDITISNIWDGLAIELIKIENTFDEIILAGTKVNGKIKFNKKIYKFLPNQDKTSVKILDLPFGSYVLNTFATSNKERPPGKHYLSLFSQSDTLIVDNLDQKLIFQIPAQIQTLGRELIIYFDPFSKNKDEEYRIFLGSSLVPSAMVKIAGELHITGFSPKYSGSIKVAREGYKPSILDIEKGSKKLYHVAFLNNPIKDEEETNKKNDRKDKKIVIKKKTSSIFSWCSGIFITAKISFEKLLRIN